MTDASDEIARLRAALAAADTHVVAAATELAQARAVASTAGAMIAALKLEIALLCRDKFGHSAERTARLIEQPELQIEELVTNAAEDTAGPDRRLSRRRRWLSSRGASP